MTQKSTFTVYQDCKTNWGQFDEHMARRHKRKRLVHLMKIANLTEQSEIFCFSSFLKSSGQFPKTQLNGFFSDAISERYQSWFSRFIPPHQIKSCATIAQLITKVKGNEIVCKRTFESLKPNLIHASNTSFLRKQGFILTEIGEYCFLKYKLSCYMKLYFLIPAVILLTVVQSSFIFNDMISHHKAIHWKGGL